MSYTNVISQDSYTSGFSWKLTRTTSSGVNVLNGNGFQTPGIYQVTKSGTNNPRWRDEVRTGNSAGTPRSLSGVRVLDYRSGTVRCTYSINSGPSKITTDEYFTGFSYPMAQPLSFLSSFSTANATALAEVLRKIDQQATQWQGLSFFAEFSDVVRQFGHPFKSIVSLTHNHLNRLESSSRGLTGSLARRRTTMSKIVADTYLEYAFGLAPLISDARKAAEALARYQYEGDPTNNPVLRKRVVGRGSETYVKDTTLGSGFIAGSGTKIVFDTIIGQQSEARVQYIVGLKTAPVANYGSNDRLLGLLGFTPSKFVPAIWEAVPWSWLVDYFTNVGDVLFSIGVDKSSVSWINKSTTMVDELSVHGKVNYTLSRQAVANAGYWTFDVAGSDLGFYKVRRTSFTRTIPSTLGWPDLVWSLPSDHLGSKLAALSAVLIQRKGNLPSSLGYTTT